MSLNWMYNSDKIYILRNNDETKCKDEKQLFWDITEYYVIRITVSEKKFHYDFVTANITWQNGHLSFAQ